jgi:hypothetical protein
MGLIYLSWVKYAYNFLFRKGVKLQRGTENIVNNAYLVVFRLEYMGYSSTY